MATTAGEAGGWRRRAARPITPDLYERILAGAAMLLLAAVISALARGAGQWERVPAIVWAHLATIVAALGLTPVMMLRRRGDRLHRRLGRVWVAAMVVTALISFGIRNRGGFSWIHGLSVFVLVAAPWVWVSAARHDVVRHRRAVRALTSFALLLAGFFTFPFDRLLGRWLFG